MTPAAEHRLTLLLLVACAVLAAIGLLPRLTVQPVRVSFEQPQITVAIEGAVRQPGAYTLPWGARVADLLDAAGGLAAGAERTLVNLADPLTSGEVIVVPAQRTAAGETRISLNSATAAELERLPGVGPATAAKIIARRPYARLDDLLRVPGIGPKTLERLRPLVTL